MIYLDNASTSFPKPEEVYTEIIGCLKNYASDPRNQYYSLGSKASKKINETRALIGNMYNIKNPSNIIFTSGATESLNIAIKGLLKQKDHVISTIIEHNSVLRPLKYLNKRGVQVTLVGVDENGLINISDIKKEIRKNTKAIIVNHGSNVLGTIQDIESIGKLADENNIAFILDAAQTAGIVPIDVDKAKIDILAFSGHKGLYGPQGIGGLYIKEGVLLENFKDGSTGSDEQSMSQPEILPYKFESGMLNLPGIVGLSEGIKFVNKVGAENIRKQEQTLVNYLYEELAKLSYVKIYGYLDTKYRCPLLSINIEGKNSVTVGALFNEKDIAVETGYHSTPLIHGIMGTYDTGTIRISPGYFNTIEEITVLIKTIKEIYWK